MKKLPIKIFTFLIICSSLISCEFGLQDFFRRFPTVDQRSGVLKDITQDLQGNFSGSHHDSNPQQWRFLMITDLHYGKESNRPEEALLESIAIHNPDFIIMTGDVTETGKESCFARYEEFEQKLHTTIENTGNKIPDFAVIGNHDLYNNGWAHWLEARKESIEKGHSFFKFTTTTGPDLNGESHARSWYFTDSGNSTLGNKQLHALQEALENDPNEKFFFTHYPFFADNAAPLDRFKWTNNYERAIYFDLFDKNNVDMIFSGHYHLGGFRDWGSFYEFTAASFIANEDIKNHWYYITIDEQNCTITVDSYVTVNSNSSTAKQEYIKTYSF